MPTNYWLKFGNTPLGYNGSGVQFTHIEQPGTLTVSLVGTGTGFDNTKNFNVLVTFGSAISYTVDGTPIATPSATCTLTLHAGQSSVIGNIPFGTTYTISENVTDEGYELGSITNPSGTMTDGGAFSSVVTNLYHAPGTLTLTKVVSGSGFDASKQFEIVATFGRAISYTVNGTPVSSPTTTYTAHLAHNQSVVLGNIPSGVSYSIVESAISDYDTYMGYSKGTITHASGTMPDGGSISSVASNSYSYGLGSVSLQLENSPRSEVVFATSGYVTLDGVQSQSRVGKLEFSSVSGTDSHTIGDCPQGTLDINLPSFGSSRLYNVVCTWKDSSGTEHTQTFYNSYGATRLTVTIYCYAGYTASVAIKRMA